MAKNTVKMTYNYDVPFFDIDFYEEYKLQIEWNDFLEEKYKEDENIFSFKKNLINDYKNKINEIQSQIKKPWYRKYNEKEKEKIEEIESLKSKIKKINDILDFSLNDSHSVALMTAYAETFLLRNNFHFTNEIDEDGIIVEIWEAS